jgi:hypothetical protein
MAHEPIQIPAHLIAEPAGGTDAAEGEWDENVHAWASPKK